MKSLPCAHAFHEICINEWLKKSSICPICRWPTTVDTNDSPHMGAAGSRGTFENYEDEYNIENEYQAEIHWFQLGEWSDESESESSDDSESEDSSDESEAAVRIADFVIILSDIFNNDRSY
ncbi:hypothetical protein AVEN_213438-1 [Araneus ventricosus]|uniref:RING-type domain-containing protein n=1 Tax=Araneus ventricosus TaxID=182803 RepID=A0A4Y2JUY9_ARAVE|nr:hypothetical protein AVEN_213438-1 [Araneus ventricosus]